MSRAVLMLAVMLAAATATLPAAVIRGTVVENTSGNLLARTLVTLQAVSAGNGRIVSGRANDRGTFVFDKLEAGAYVVRASRPGFLAAEYGQKRWNSAGTAIVVDGDGVATLNIRLSRYGAVTGVVRDENEVGIANQDVAAYKDTQPPEWVARGTSDDRGVFRIGGLVPGRYIVRTTGGIDGDIHYLATFSSQTLRVEEARSVDVFLDEDSRDADVRPIRGTLYSLSGAATPAPAGLAVTVTLASDMGRRTSEGPGFNFRALPPGLYDLYAVAKDEAGRILYGAYTQVRLDRDMKLPLAMAELRPIRFSIDGTQSPVTIVARHKDLAGLGESEVLDSARPMLEPGKWDFMILPPAGYYVSRFSPAPRDQTVRPDGWNEVTVDGRGFQSVNVSVTGGGGSLHGAVKTPGAPVFLEGWDSVTRRRLVDLRTTRTDSQGRYRFDSLPPGSFRVLATFEYAMPDAAAMDLAGAREIQIEAHTDQQLDLDLYEGR